MQNLQNLNENIPQTASLSLLDWYISLYTWLFFLHSMHQVHTVYALIYSFLVWSSAKGKWDNLMRMRASGSIFVNSIKIIYVTTFNEPVESRDFHVALKKFMQFKLYFWQQMHILILIFVMYWSLDTLIGSGHGPSKSGYYSCGLLTFSLHLRWFFSYS